MKRTVMFLAVTCLLSGCGIYGRFSRPDLGVAVDSLYRAPMAADDTSSMASMSWRGLFTDPELQALIDAGLANNTDLGVARLQVEEAQAALANARLSYLPSLNLTPQAGVSRYDGETRKTYDLGAAASWELDVFGKAANARRGAAAVLEQRQAYSQAVQTQLVATIAESYYTLLMLDEQLAVSGQTLANWDETIAAMEALVEAGKVNDVAVRQARAGRAELEASVLTVRRSISEMENSLCALLKETPHTVVRGTLEGQQFPDALSAGVPLLLLSNRPDVRQSEAALAEAFYAANAARSAFYPSLTLSGTLGWTNSGGNIVNPGKWLANAVAQLTAPLFNKGTNVANLKIAKARQQEAVLAFEQSLLDAGNDVNNAVAEWQTADGRIRLDAQRISDLEAAVEKTRLLMRCTSVNYLEVLTAQQSLLAARLTLAQDRTARIYGVIHLYHALGGGRD